MSIIPFPYCSFSHKDTLLVIPEGECVFSQRPISISHRGIQALEYGCVMKKLKSTVAILLGALVVLIAFQNMSLVELTFLFWTFETRRIVLITMCVIIGFLLGKITSTHKQPSQGDQ